jgi:acyl-CoA thioesterase-1
MQNPGDGRLKTILFFGDSITAGLGIDPDQAFPALIQKKVEGEKWMFRVINGGVSGETSAGGLRRINWVLQRKIDVLILELGGNDALRGVDLENTKSNLQGIIERVRKKDPEVRIIVAGMQAPPNLGLAYTTKFQKMYPDLVKKNKTDFIPFILQDVGGIRDLNLPDGIHPTVEGHKIVAETVWKVLKPVLVSIMR